jgi:hypothetical protein
MPEIKENIPPASAELNQKLSPPTLIPVPRGGTGGSIEQQGAFLIIIGLPPVRDVEERRRGHPATMDEMSEGEGTGEGMREFGFGNVKGQINRSMEAKHNKKQQQSRGGERK